MNIMLASVTERTREIGIRMAMDILLQFLLEALTICLVDGRIGILLGVGAAWLTSGMMVEITLRAIGVSFLFSFAVGACFGCYPARRAASLRRWRRCRMSEVVWRIGAP